ncbi:TlpA family protein disulfide reductase [Gaetbulibacter saemankumensis]|uniref:TlpA family protein disulfide reductase n=1 Tax=Gaetbulibacter saemankumensis TaxID=311208 RepID=UPI0004196B92|nr:TlpA disulfide reductase family protein [Gaetbulibacter saemankumensis]
MNWSKLKIKNILYIVLIALLIIPQTRKPIQIFLNKGLALFAPSVKSDSELVLLNDYQWQLRSGDNKIKQFTEAKGKVVLVNFWATWCPPCIAEMPSLQALYNDYKDKVEFVFVTSDDFEEVNQFLSKNSYSFEVYQPNSKSPELFNVNSIPRTFLIDQEGQIIIDETGAANWNSDKVRQTIDGLLKK